MVMEAKPSPLVVGREFVRQYYTLLHNSPDHLHRFYNQHSSFTHSGVDPDASKEDGGLVIGQKNIHDKIQQMNFRDCHAKISHVDAQATLGDGVVVQVFGELSNDGHQMRRFTQTFVLACQSPKKYYVHNDIFRYHDIYCEDEDQREEHEIGTESSGGASNNSTDGSSTTGAMMVPPPVFYAAAPPASVIPVVNASPAMVPTGFTTAAAAAVVPPPAQQPPQQVNGIMHEEMLKNIATQTSQSPQIISVPPQVAVLPMAPAPTALPIPVEPVAVVSSEVIMPTTNKVNANNSVATTTAELNQYDADQSNGEDSDTLENNKENDVTSSLDEKTIASPAPMHVSSSTTPLIAPKNWANLVKAGPGIHFTGTVPQPPDVSPVAQPQSFIAITQQQQQQAQQQKQQAETYSTTIVDRRSQNRPIGNTPASSAPDARERRVSSNNNSNSNNNNNNNTNNNNSSANSDGSSQLFLGNLPTSATEEELRTLFSVFGKISDLRIHTKQTQKGSNGRPVPNYGFITFENPSSAQRLQDAQPIYYPVLSDKRGTKLNIEHKIRKNTEAGAAGTGNNAGGRQSGNDQNDRGRNSNPGNGMNRNGSGGRSDRRGGDDRNRQFNRSDRGMGGGGGGGARTTNGNATSGTYTNSRR